MSFTLVTPQVTLARNAGALYNYGLGSELMASLASSNDINGLLNSIYMSSIGNATTSQVAKTLVANLGITGNGVAAAEAYVVAQLNPVAEAGRGKVVNDILMAFSSLTGDATYGEAAKAWNAKVADAVAYAGMAGSKDTTFAAAVPPTVEAPSFMLTAGESVDEGKSTIVTLSTKGVASGATINYIISGEDIDENDVASLTGSTTVGLDGKAYITVRALADKTTEGTETMTLTVGSATASVKINDLSLDQGKSITLTTAANSGPDFTGGAADDMFQGIVTDAAATTTLSAGDILDGGAGTDTLMVAVSGAIAAGQTSTAFMLKGIEKFTVSNYDTGANTLTFDMSGATDVTTLGVSGSSLTGDTIFGNVLAKADLDLSNALGPVTVTYPTAFVGTADTQKVSLSNVGQGATGTHNVAVTVAGTEVFDITATGKNTLLGGITGGASTSVNTIKIGGAGSLTIGNLSTTLSNLDNTVKTVDASANTGGVSLTLGNGAQNVLVTGGAGNDVVRTGTHLTIDDTINGGDGTDTLIVDEGADVVTGLKVTNFESLRMVSGTGTVNMNFLAGMTAVDYRMSAAADGATVSNAPAAATVRISADAGALVHGVKDANLVSATADSLAVTLKNSATAPADVDVASLTIEGIETLSIDSSGAPATAVVATDAQNSITIAQTAGANSRTLATVTVTGSSDLSLALPASDKLTAINAADFTGALTLTNTSASTTARTTITGGSGNDVIAGRGAALADSDSISAGAGDDTISGGGGADFLDGGAGNDVITGNSLTTTVTGNDTIKGGDGNDTISPGSGADNIDGGAGDDAISFALSNTAAGVATGTLTSADVVDGGEGTDTITFTGALTVASTLDLASVTNTTFTGVKNVEAVVLATSTSALTVTLGDIALGSFNNAASFNNKGATAAVNVDAGGVLNSSASVTFTGTTAASGVAQGAGYTVGNNKDIVTFAGGDDTLTIATPTFLQATDSITGGIGNDTIAIANSASTDVSFTAAQLGAVTSFETFAVNSTSLGEAAKVTFTLTDAVAVANALATTGALTITRDASDTGGLTVNASALTNRTVSVAGGGGADSLVGGAGNDTLGGGAGADTLDGGAGNDILTATSVTYGESFAGGTGDDELHLGGTVSLTGVTISGVESVLVNAPTLGTTYTVSMRHDSGYSFAFGSAANSVTATTTSAAAQQGNIVLAVDLLGAITANLSAVTSAGAGSAGTLTTTYSNGVSTGFANYTLTGLGDTFTGAAGVVYNLNGAGGNDVLAGGNSADVVDGGSGNDTITMDVTAGASDTLLGGSGTDTLILTGLSVAGTTIDLSSATDQVTAMNGGAALSNTAPQTGFENVDMSGATAGSITIVAASTGSVITGSSLADSITGGVGADRVVMGYAGQTIVEDTVAAGSGTDTLVVVGSGANATIVVNLTSTTDQYGSGAAQTGFENVDLSQVTDGTTTSFTITAVTSGSQIAGSQGPDAITGGAGNDSIYGVYGTDTIAGGAGTDTLFLISNATSVTSSPFQSNAAATAGGAVAVGTVTAMTGIENVTISGNFPVSVSFANQIATEPLNISAAGMAITYLSGATQTPTSNITGGAGADTITGSSLADTIAGGAGNDIINSGAGNDSVTGGTGGDTINVGTGTDTVVLGATDSGTATTDWTFAHGTAATNVATAIDAGDSWTLASIDVITGLGTGDTLDLPGTAAASTINGTSGIALAAAASATGSYATSRGSWSGTAFSFDAAGADLLVIYADGAAYDAVVLVGSGATPPTFG